MLNYKAVSSVPIIILVEESGLFVFDAEFTVDGGKDALHLSEGEHASEERIAGIMAVAAFIHDASRLVCEGHAVVDTHRQLRVLLLKDTAELDEVGTSAKVRSLCKVAIREDMARAQMNEVGTRSELLCELYHIIISTC